MNVSIIGAGVAGLTCATELVSRGVAVTIFEQSDSLGDSACSWFAGGMLAPWCEQESAESIVGEFGKQALGWWAGHVDNLITNGSLVVSIQRDTPTH